MLHYGKNGSPKRWTWWSVREEVEENRLVVVDAGWWVSIYWHQVRVSLMEENKPGLMIAGWLSRMTAASDRVSEMRRRRWSGWVWDEEKKGNGWEKAPLYVFSGGCLTNSEILCPEANRSKAKGEVPSRSAEANRRGEVPKRSAEARGGKVPSFPTPTLLQARREINSPSGVLDIIVGI